MSDTAEADLPKAMLKRIVKAKLTALDLQHGGDGSRDFQLAKDALLAFSEAGKLFIHYLTATANDVCKEAKRQTINAEDVLTALTDLEFDELVEPLKETLEAFKAESREKSKKRQVGRQQGKGMGGCAPVPACLHACVCVCVHVLLAERLCCKPFPSTHTSLPPPRPAQQHPAPPP
jgi:DNA polymerase epsilon subunit 3